MKGKLIREIIEEKNSMAQFMPVDFDKALVGYGRKSGNISIAIYDMTSVLLTLINDKGMSEIDAYEHFEKSMKNGFASDHDPIFINDFRDTRDIKLKLSTNLETSIKDLNID